MVFRLGAKKPRPYSAKPIASTSTQPQRLPSHSLPNTCQPILWTFPSRYRKMTTYFMDILESGWHFY